VTTSEQTAPPRIAVVAQFDPADPSSWSGTPAGICKGLAAAGAQPIAIDARPPGLARAARALRASWTWEATSPAYAWACGAWGDLLVRARGVDGVVAIGSGFALRTAAPVVSFEDETVAQALRRPGSPLAAIGERPLRRWQRRQGRIYARARGCCVASSGVARSIAEDYGIDRDKVHVVGCGRNIEMEPAERDWSVPRFLFVGVDWRRKRGDDVVASFAAVRVRHPEATLDVVGAHPPLEAPGVSGHGRLSLSSPAERERLASLFSTATCLVLPSSYEPFGIAYVEAGAAGVPSIGTTAGGAADAIGEGGIVVDPGDGAALTAAMLSLCDPQTARQLGERARERARLFTWQAVAERVLRALRPAGLDLGGFAEDVPAAAPKSLSGRNPP
jgi:glycosyltransferase involved in cell wall biosynthesis